MTCCLDLWSELKLFPKGTGVLGQDFAGLKRIVAIICMAIACLFYVQTVLVNIDRMEHALELEHDANSLAGTVQYCAVTPDACGQAGDVHPVSHAHQGDTAMSVLAASFSVLPTAYDDKGTMQLSHHSAGRGLEQLVPERPPKA